MTLTLPTSGRAMTTRSRGLKPTMDIEAALRWAYRDELPKAGALNRDELDSCRGGSFLGPRRERGGTTTQMLVEMPTNCFGVLHEVGARRPPHPDAIMIGDAVRGLDDMVMGVPEGWKPLAEMDDLSPEVTRLVEVAVRRITREVEGGKRLFGMRPSVLIQRHALAGGAPRWQAEVPEVKLVSERGKPKWFVMRNRWFKTVNGGNVAQEVEEDGYDPRGKRPFPDAYRKLYLDPDPAPAIEARAEYELWHAALDALASDLAPRLISIRLTPTLRVARPWIEGEVGPSVLPDLSDMGPL